MSIICGLHSRGNRERSCSGTRKNTVPVRNVEMSLEVTHLRYSVPDFIQYTWDVTYTQHFHSSLLPPIVAGTAETNDGQPFVGVPSTDYRRPRNHKAMMEWPLFRSSITPGTTGKPTLTVRPQADIAIALSTPSGLYTPTIQSANTQSMYGIAAQLKHLSYLGRQTPCGLTPKEIPKKGGTLTVSNVGAIGKGEYASPVLVEGGGVGIVALGRGRWVWDVEEGEGERRLKMGISWSADHRVVEGAELAAFVECWRSYVEKPEVLIGGAV